ncbi:MAG: GIY-YIG nuclease family protein [Gammaproteobacteria bacterium]
MRTFFVEYFHRILEHGPDSLPSSFNVIESFLFPNTEFLSFDLREEREHLLQVDDYFDWYSRENLPRDPRLLMDSMEDGIVYSFDMASDASGYRIQTEESAIVLAGIALVRHANELSCLLVAGENPPHPPDKEILERLEDTSGYTPRIGRESIVPDPVFTVKSRYLDGFPEHARVLMLTRFDLEASNYNVRYINLDTGPSYSVMTDDLSSLDAMDLGDLIELKKHLLEGLKRYDALFSALASLIYLPLVFIDEHEHTHNETFTTEFFLRKDEGTAKKVVAEFNEPVYMYERTIRCLATLERSADATHRIVPPEMKFMRDGYWKPLAPGQIGQGKNGERIAGQTWVSRMDSWSAQRPDEFLLKRPSLSLKGDDPGIVYIMRSPAHDLEVYKVGLTRKSAEGRADDLSRTAAPLKFGILAQWDVGNCRAVEQEVHNRLNAYRINPKREFFHCKLTDIVSCVDQVIKDLESS